MDYGKKIKTFKDDLNKSKIINAVKQEVSLKTVILTKNTDELLHKTRILQIYANGGIDDDDNIFLTIENSKYGMDRMYAKDFKTLLR